MYGSLVGIADDSACITSTQSRQVPCITTSTVPCVLVPRLSALPRLLNKIVRLSQESLEANPSELSVSGFPTADCRPPTGAETSRQPHR